MIFPQTYHYIARTLLTPQSPCLAAPIIPSCTHPDLLCHMYVCALMQILYMKEKTYSSDIFPFHCCLLFPVCPPSAIFQPCVTQRLFAGLFSSCFLSDCSFSVRGYPPYHHPTSRLVVMCQLSPAFLCPLRTMNTLKGAGIFSLSKSSATACIPTPSFKC